MKIVLSTAQKGYRRMPSNETHAGPELAQIEPVDHHVAVRFGGETIADSRSAIRVTEAGHPPVYYVPPEDVRVEVLDAIDHVTESPHKGIAHYYDIVVGDTRAEAAAWCYPEPKSEFAAIQSAIAFYPAHVDATIDGRPVSPEDNPSDGGWVIEES